MLYFSTLDIFLRYQHNDCILNIFYIFWTNTWYLYIFLFALFFYAIFWVLKTGPSISCSLLLHLSLYFFIGEFYIYWSLNNYNTNTSLFSENFNQLLTNSINKYHPFLFYIGLLTSFQGLLFLKNVQSKNIITLYGLNKNLNTFIKQYNYIIILFFTLYLGSWWALQEGSWGGWWNWDPSEVFGLITAYFFLWRTHTQFNYKFQYQTKYVIQLLITFLFLSYSFIQLNFRLVSHNFGTKVAWFIDTDQFNLLLVVVVFLYSYYLFYRFFKINNSVSILNLRNIRFNKPTNFYKVYSLGVFYLLITLQVFLSFTLLINDFFWKFFNVNIFNSNLIVSLDSIILILVLLLLLLSNSNLSRIWFKLLSLPSLNYLVLYLSTLKFSYNVLNLQHFLLLVFITYSYSALNYSFSGWSSLEIFSYDYFGIVINSNVVEIFNSFPNPIKNEGSVFNFININETTEAVKTFSLDIDNNKLTQVLGTGWLNHLFFITINDFSIKNLNLLFLAVLYLLGIFFHKTTIILF